MKADVVDSRLLLLVEDNEGDAGLVDEIMAGAVTEDYRVLRATTLAAAISLIEAHPVDVVVLDLRLPDCEGVDSVRALHAVAEGVPIVVLTGADDPELASRCLQAGAQDYLEKGEMRAANLRRAIGYAITRIREAQIREMRLLLERYRQMSSASRTTSVTAALAGAGNLADREPRVFNRIVATYLRVIGPMLATRGLEPVDASRLELEAIATQLGDLNAGPRDLIDVHLEAIDRAISRKEGGMSGSVAFEARLVALRMMGLLAEYYRVGQRRYLETEGDTS